MILVASIFEHSSLLHQALAELKVRGFSSDRISVVGPGSSITPGSIDGLSALALPGIGPIVIAGPLTDIVAKTRMDELSGALHSYGITGESNELYEDEVRLGNILCLVEASSREQAKAVKKVLLHYGARQTSTYGDITGPPKESTLGIYYYFDGYRREATLFSRLHQDVASDQERLSFVEIRWYGPSIYRTETIPCSLPPNASVEMKAHYLGEVVKVMYGLEEAGWNPEKLRAQVSAIVIDSH